jgi:hypothetical protein
MNVISDKFAHHADLHAYGWGNVELQLEQFRDKGDTFNTLVTLLQMTDAGPIVRYYAANNLLAERTVTALAKKFASRVGGTSSEWEDRLVAVAKETVDQYRDGQSVLQRLSDIEVDRTKPAYVLYPLIAENGLTIQYGDSSVGKSFVVGAQLLSVCTGYPFLGMEPKVTGPVIYFDWEDNAETIRERMEALCEGAGIPVPDNFHYRQMDRSIISGQARIRREVEETGAVVAVFDSMGEMLGGDPSDTTLVIPAVNVLKRLGCAAVGIHHLSAEQAASTDIRRKQKPYGSVYARSGARLQWLIERIQEEEADEGDIYMFNTKINRGKKSRPLSWNLRYESDENDYLQVLRYTPRSAGDFFDRVREETAPADLTVKDAIERVLSGAKGAGVSYDGLLLHVNRMRGRQTTLATIQAKVSELVKAGTCVRIAADGGPFIALRSDREPDF